MVNYHHCKKCKKIYDTVPWIGEVHTYNGMCPSCIDEEKNGNQLQQEVAENHVMNKDDTETIEGVKDTHEDIQSSPIEIEKDILSRLEQMANDVISSNSSIDVLIKEIKVGLVDKAKERIEKTFQSFDVNIIDAQKVVDYVDKTFDYLSEYKDYMDNVIKKLQSNPKLKVKTAIEKVYKDTLGNMPKNVAKDVLFDKKTMLKTIFGKSVKWYNIYSDTEDVMELTKKMVLHPFNEIQKKISTLPFYT
ncbi:MAG: hypothetical protein ACFE9Q_12725 [Candidatus Hodarchaeota archaeon]